jgi:hypothetical protein
MFFCARRRAILIMVSGGRERPGQDCCTLFPVHFTTFQQSNDKGHATPSSVTVLQPHSHILMSIRGANPGKKFSIVDCVD